MKTNLYSIKQQGAVLLMSLVLLIVLTLLGISALDSTKLETRMAANNKEDHTAFQAANAGLDQAFHHYVFQGATDNYADLTDFPEEGEWSEEEIVVLEKNNTKSNTPGLQFDNDAAASLRIKKVVIPNTSDYFFIIESTGSTGCSDGTCDGHDVTLVEGWSFKGAEKSSEHSDELKKCLTFSDPDCKEFFENINTCAGDPACQADIVPLSCRQTPAGSKPLPDYCITIFTNITAGFSI